MSLPPQPLKGVNSMTPIRSLQKRITKNNDTHILIYKSEFIEKWVEVKMDVPLPVLTIHINSHFGGTHKHESVTLSIEDLKAVIATAEEA